MSGVSSQQYGSAIASQHPCPSIFAGLRTNVLYRPAESIGGDFYSVSSPRFAEATVLIGDACGKGAAAAEWVDALGWTIRQLSRRGARPAEFLYQLGQVATHTLPDNGFITAACVHIDALQGRAIIANAAHVPALIRSASGKTRIVGRASGAPLGIENGRYQEEVVLLKPNETLILMTDGIVEPFETDLENLTMVRELVQQRTSGLSELNNRLFSAAALARREPDDATLVSVEMTPLDSRVFAAG